LGKRDTIRIILAAAAIILILPFSSLGQQPLFERQNQERKSLVEHSPHKATMYSAVVPGLGQIYNKRYWKLPIIYGAAGIFIYQINYHSDEYNKYRNAYLDMTNGKIDEFEVYSSEETLKNIKDNYRRNRDLSVIGLAAVYLLNILDATVDAHFFHYEINRNLSMQVVPAVSPMALSPEKSMGLTCSFSF
jgi:hypothetical protein